MSSISIEHPPESAGEELTTYLNRMQININIALSQSNQIPKIYELPKNPQNAKIYYFTQSVGSTITSPGFWGYEEGSWVKL